MGMRVAKPSVNRFADAGYAGAFGRELLTNGISLYAAPGSTGFGNSSFIFYNADMSCTETEDTVRLAGSWLRPNGV